MYFNLATAEIFIPDGLSEEQALARTTHMAVGAHPDDLEILAAGAILQCFQKDEEWFAGVVVTDGRGSPRGGPYEKYNDEEMRLVRLKEQKKAAVLGEYAAQVSLDYPSKEVHDAANLQPVEDIARLLTAATPRIVFTHNLGDRHDTHVAVALKVIEATRSLPESLRPEKLYGCEVWRDLDWMVTVDKVPFDLSTRENIQAALLGVFDSQISGGKRYDLGTLGRRRAHAAYFESHGADRNLGLAYAMDLTPLILETDKDIGSFVQEFIDRFAGEVADRLKRVGRQL